MSPLLPKQQLKYTKSNQTADNVQRAREISNTDDDGDDGAVVEVGSNQDRKSVV